MMEDRLDFRKKAI
jgi:hypothetical protein